MIKQSIKTRLTDFLKRNRPALLLLVFGIIYMTWFRYLENHVTCRFHIIHMAIDDYIPFCEIFVVPYLCWFGYVAFAIGYFYFHNKKEYFQLCAFLFTGMTLFLIISTVYPNGHYLRPYYFDRNNIFTKLVGWIYSSDTATNLFPSIHVYNSLGVHIAVCNSREFRENKRVKTASFIMMSSIILSTMLIKQHSVFDVVTAFCLAAAMYSFVYVRAFRHASEKERVAILK